MYDEGGFVALWSRCEKDVVGLKVFVLLGTRGVALIDLAMPGWLLLLGLRG